MDNLKAFGKITQLIPEKVDEAIINVNQTQPINKQIVPILEESKVLSPPVIDAESEEKAAHIAAAGMIKDLSKITEKNESI